MQTAGAGARADLDAFRNLEFVLEVRLDHAGVVVVLRDVLERHLVRAVGVDLGERISSGLHTTTVSTTVAHVVDLFEAHAAQVVPHVEQQRDVGALRQHRTGATGLNIRAGVSGFERDQRRNECLAHFPRHHLAQQLVVDVVLVHREVAVVVLDASGHDQHGRVAVLDQVAELGLGEFLEPHGVDAVDGAWLVRRRPGRLRCAARAARGLRGRTRREQRHRQPRHQCRSHHVSGCLEIRRAQDTRRASCSPQGVRSRS